MKIATVHFGVQVAGAQRKAAAERQTLAVLIEALAPHKASLALVPQESVASTLARFGSSSLDPEAGVDAHAAPLLGGRGADESLAETVAAAALAVNKARLVSARLLTYKHSACNTSNHQTKVEDSAADLLDCSTPPGPCQTLCHRVPYWMTAPCGTDGGRAAGPAWPNTNPVSWPIP